MSATAADDPAENAGEVQRFPCGSCGALLTYRPGTTSLTCAWCGHENPIAASRAELVVEELDYHQWLERLESDAPKDEQAVVACGACGAEVERPADLEAFRCPYCAAPLAAGETVRRSIRPAALLPFGIDHDRAHRAFGTWLEGLWLAPTRLRREARREGKLRGLYVPYWTFDAESTTSYRGERGDDYWVTVGKRRVRRTSWSGAAGVVGRDFDDLLVPATRSLPAPMLNALEPWDLGALTAYGPEWLAGFETEIYRIDLEQGFAIARAAMEARIRADVERDIGGDHQRIHAMHPRFENVRFKHVLLPLWVAAYRFRGKVYRFTVNARTGEVHGERPWSAWKIALLVIAGLAIIALVAVLTQG